MKTPPQDTAPQPPKSPALHPEEACRKCGRCCYEKIVVNNEVFCTSIPCPYLDPLTRHCTIYADRLKLNPDCLTVAKGIEFRAFPADCPYVSHLADYRPPRPEIITPQVLDLLETGKVRNVADLIRLARQHPPCDDLDDAETPAAVKLA